MADFTGRRLRILFDQLRQDSTEEEAYQNMQRILPPDPVNYEPYSKDQIWAWMRGAETSELDDRLDFWGGDFVQTVKTGDNNYYSFRMELPGNHNILTLLTTEEGYNVRLQTAQAIMRRRLATGQSGGYRGPIQLTDIKAINRYAGTHKEPVMIPEDYLEEDDYEDLEYGDEYYDEE